MNFLNRFQGIFLSPQQTFKAISERPIWLDALIILLIAIALFSYITAPYSNKDSIQMFENNIKLKEKIGEERFNQMLEDFKNPSQTRVIIRSFFIVPISSVIGFLISSLIILGLGRLTSTEGKFVYIFSAFLYANFIDKILGNAVRLFLAVSRKSVMQNTTSLALFFPKLEITSPAFLILSQVDFFQLWLFGIFGFALAYIFKIELKKALFISYGFWLLKSVFYIAIIRLSMSLTGLG